MASAECLNRAGKHGADRSALSNAVRQRRHGCDVIMLKDPKKRLWPVIYHHCPLFVGFTEGWKHLVAANDLRAGDVCELVKGPDDVCASLLLGGLLSDLSSRHKRRETHR
jgi:hypothetical protein